MPDDPAIPTARRHATAVSVFATLVGTLQLARLVHDEVESDKILNGGIATALTLAGLTPRDESA